MYESFFGLQCEPFSVAPDPRFLYLSPQHRQALEHLNHGLHLGGGFVLLTGEIGAGKTTVWRAFLEQLPPGFDVAYVVNPRLGVDALLARVCEDLRVEPPADGAPARDPVDALHGHLLLAHAAGRRALIVVDEAQALSAQAFEMLRLLTNLVTSERKLLQVLLIGQPELRQMMLWPSMEPLAQRVVARYHLKALAEEETLAYIRHRLTVAGRAAEPPFDSAALRRIHRLCGGVPRRINVLCDRSLIAAHGLGRPQVDQVLVDRAARDVFARPGARWAHWARRAGLATGAVAAGLAAAWWFAPMFTGDGGVVQPQVSTAMPTPVYAGHPDTVLPANAAPVVAAASAVPSAEQAAGVVVDAAALRTAIGLAAGDDSAAWQVLGTQWGASPAQVGCATWAAQGLACWRGRGGFAALRLLDRPALLPLTDGQGRSAAAVLVGLDEAEATLMLGARPLRVAVGTLGQAWAGTFTTLWRAPPGLADAGRQPSAPAADDVARPMLLQRLAHADGGASEGVDGAALQARVRSFQLTQGLAADGVAGPMTWMLLNRAGGVDEPRLRALRRAAP
ncbi:MAG: AAA family ATPase [Aquabacterium sp.]|nr:AAA family ATPase [Aquabacterium sp.]